MLWHISIKNFAYICIVLGILLACWFLYYGNYLVGNMHIPDKAKIKEISPFISGIVLPIFTLGTTLLLIETFKNSNIQNVYNNVFKMIDQNRKILDNVNKDTSENEQGDIVSTGKDFFDDLAFKISQYFSILSGENTNIELEIDKELIETTKGKEKKQILIDIYDYFFHIYQSDLGHYFRNLFHTVSYIDRAKIHLKHKQELANILRSNLSNYELLILAYNCLHYYGEPFYEYIEKYKLLKSINSETKLPLRYNKRIVSDLTLLTENYPHLKKLWNDDGK